VSLLQQSPEVSGGEEKYLRGGGSFPSFVGKVAGIATEVDSGACVWTHLPIKKNEGSAGHDGNRKDEVNPPAGSREKG